MIKKIQIFFILIVFFGSTTSLPITIHLCKMMDNMETLSCKMNMSKKMVDNHCGININNLDVSNKSFKNIPCCVKNFEDFKIKDDFVPVVNNTNNLLSQLICAPNNFIDLSSINTNSSLKIRMDSPPNKTDNHLYLSISSLLI